jgi:hypothetical protein
MHRAAHLQQQRPAATPRLRQINAGTGTEGGEQAGMYSLLRSG